MNDRMYFRRESPLRMMKPGDVTERIELSVIDIPGEIVDKLPDMIYRAQMEYVKQYNGYPEFAILNETGFGALKAHMDMRVLDPMPMGLWRFGDTPEDRDTIYFERMKVICDPKQEEIVRVLPNPLKAFGMIKPDSPTKSQTIATMNKELEKRRERNEYLTEKNNQLKEQLDQSVKDGVIMLDTIEEQRDEIKELAKKLHDLKVNQIVVYLLMIVLIVSIVCIFEWGV